MVHERRLTTSPIVMIVIPYIAIVILSICQVCLTQEHISHNLIRDNIELGNPYQHINYSDVQRRKHPNYHHRRPSPTSQHNFSTQTASVSEEEETSPVLDEYIVQKETHRDAHKIAHNAKEESEEEICPMCAAAQANSKIIASLDEETLRAVRIEIVKKQILKKLRLKEPPKMDSMSKGHNTVIPPIALGNPELTNAIRHDQDDDPSLDLEDFYGKTEQIIVLPQDEVKECGSWGNKARSEAATCFIFNLPKEVRSTQISSAELWVYKLADDMADDDNANGESVHNFSTSEVTYHYSRSSRKPAFQFHQMATRENISESTGWINFNITDRARKWLVAEVQDHTIKVSCTTCSKENHESPFDSVDEQQPFIVFNIANGKRKRRHRRSLNCTPGVKECCRESLKISFEEIKWDWVVEPRGFDAYYCKGRCHGDAALAHTATRHSGLMIDYVKSKGGVNNETVEFVPCCTATEMSSMSLIYREDSNTTLLRKVDLPNMIVKSCGCK